ncbi:unnamed protein product [Lactuca saligna]|uniref:Uncharacterized protein n=1 Tax=Lactuca saligna TaxID=75948 RepID=A0AA36DWY3_LACSI|nr:unnamed protein product [Lactuca saligna]
MHIPMVSPEIPKGKRIKCGVVRTSTTTRESTELHQESPRLKRARPSRRRVMDKVNVQLIDVINKEIKIRSPVLSQHVYCGEEGHLAYLDPTQGRRR